MGGNLGVERARALGVQRIGQRGQRVFILRLAGELVVPCAILGEGAHQAALVIGVLEPVQEHVVDHLTVADPRAAAHLGQQIGGFGHALHAAGDHDAGLAQRDLVMGNHRRLHARSAHLVQGRGRHALAQTGPEPGLPRGGLALAGGQNTAHQQFVDPVRGDARARQRRGDCRAAQIGRRHARKDTLKSAHRCAGGASDHHVSHRNLRSRVNLLARSSAYREQGTEPNRGLHGYHCTQTRSRADRYGK